MAEMLLDEKVRAIEEKGYLTVDEPAAGSGGMILALAQALKRRGYDSETQLYVQATDINALAYWMCFIQLSLANIPANVIRGNSLSLETFETSWTMACVPFFGRHKDIFEEPAPSENNLIINPHPVEIKQLALF
jgi:type I restriction-modification system DNA methylase subunit